MSFAKAVRMLSDFLIEHVPEEELSRVNALFVFGHYEPLVARHAARLWKKGFAPHIIVSGKGRDAIPEGFETEAEFYASLLESDGVPPEVLVLEKRATNSLENVVWGVAAGRAAGLRLRTLILCALPPLLRRSCATFRKQFPNMDVRGSAFAMPVEWFSPRRIARLVGEIDRLVAYANKGDIAPVDIPPEILSAAEILRSAQKTQ